MDRYHSKIRSSKIPAFLYGTGSMRPLGMKFMRENTSPCLKEAVKIGFEGIDTANQPQCYFEPGVGEALDQIYSTRALQRDQLFLQTKFTPESGHDQQAPYDPQTPIAQQVIQSFESSLKNLRTDYIDSYLYHVPCTDDILTEDDWLVWQTMEMLAESGKVHFLGVCNFDIRQLELLTKYAKIKPSFIQNRCFIEEYWDREIREHCKKNGITYQGFHLIPGNKEFFKHPLFQEAVTRYECTNAQLIYAIAINLGIIPITGTTNTEHMGANLNSIDIKIKKNDLHKFETLVDQQ
jgi:diketogulonate reductase-like aldo/keto reductase